MDFAVLISKSQTASKIERRQPKRLLGHVIGIFVFKLSKIEIARLCRLPIEWLKVIAFWASLTIIVFKINLYYLSECVLERQELYCVSDL